MSRVSSQVAGYTIVETMIFLAVSGFLFASAMLLVGGQQKNTEFTTTVRDFDSKLQSVINNVSNGYYNNTGSTSCTVSGGVITVTANGGTAGTNQDCTFVGQYISLKPSKTAFTVTSYVGLRRVGPPMREVQSLAEANPTPFTDTAQDYNLSGGVTASMKIVGGGDIDTLKITNTFSQYGGGGDLASGNSRVELHAYNSALNTDVINPASGVQICLVRDDQVGVILLNTGSTEVTIGNVCP